MREMKFSEYRFLVASDLYRIAGNSNFSSFLYNLALYPGFMYAFWMRTCAYAKSTRVLSYLLFPFARLMLHCYEYRLGITISYRTKIGSGFYIGHFGGIVVNPYTIIGKNCNISHGVTLGKINRGERAGYPVIGDNVYIGPGAKIIGAVRVGDHAAVGANCVVTRDVPDYGVVAGIPGQVISMEGSTGYVNNTDY